MAETAKIDQRGAVLLPSAARARFGLDAGATIAIELRPDGILLRPALARPTDEEREQFFARLHAEAEAMDPAVREEERAELALWDATLMDGLDPDEDWADEREQRPGA